MRSVLAVSVLAAIPAGSLQAQTDLQTQAGPGARAEAHIHLGHVAEAFADTPIGQGLLPAAVAEADIALAHARLAVEDSLSLVGMRRHAGHVVHALDPTLVGGSGPGLGYGVRRAAEEATRHVELAAAAVPVTVDDPTAYDPAVGAVADPITAVPAGGDPATLGPLTADRVAPDDTAIDRSGADDIAAGRPAPDGQNIARHAPHITTSLANAVRWTDQAIELAQTIQTTPSVASALPLVIRLAALCHAIRWGRDADGDGIVGWQEGEGGLAQAMYHSNSLRRGEGLAY